MMMVVDEMQMIPPRKMLSIVLQPSSWPRKKPAVAINVCSVSAVTPAVPPTATSFLKLNSSPKLNRRKITPISLHVVMFFSSATVGKKPTCGPTSSPARM
jgi:hypothetical protein